MKTFKQLNKLKNPMRNLDLVIEFIDTLGEHTLTINDRASHYKKEFFNVGNFQLINAKAKKSYSAYVRTDGYICVRNNLFLNIPIYDDVYKLSYDLKTKKIRYATIGHKELFSDLRNLFLKFVLNKEQLEKQIVSKKATKVNKI